MSNKISSKSYCIKRLRDCGYHVDKLDSIEYTESDHRKWSAIIDPNGLSIFLTCNKDETFNFYDGGRYLQSSMKLNTDSVEVMVEFLNNQGIINKHYLYGKAKNVPISYK